MIRFSLIFILFHFTNVQNKSIEEKILKILNDNGEHISYDPSVIPLALIENIKLIMNDNTFCISAPDSAYNYSDNIINKNYCRRALMFTVNTDKKFVMCYKRGGPGQTHQN